MKVKILVFESPMLIYVKKKKVDMSHRTYAHNKCVKFENSFTFHRLDDTNEKCAERQKKINAFCICATKHIENRRETFCSFALISKTKSIIFVTVCVSFTVSFFFVCNLQVCNK